MPVKTAWLSSCRCAHRDPAAVEPLEPPMDAPPPDSRSSALPLPRNLGRRGRVQRKEMLEPAMFIGLGAVAVWAHLRFPRLRPTSTPPAVFPVAVAFAALPVLPTR